MNSRISLILKEIRENNSILREFTDEELIKLAVFNLYLDTREVKKENA